MRAAAKEKQNNLERTEIQTRGQFQVEKGGVGAVTAVVPAQAGPADLLEQFQAALGVLASSNPGVDLKYLPEPSESEWSDNDTTRELEASIRPFGTS